MGDYLVSVLQPNLGNKLTTELANGLIHAIEKKHHELVAMAVKRSHNVERIDAGGSDVA